MDVEVLGIVLGKTVCSLAGLDEKEIRDGETQAAFAGVQREGRPGSIEERGNGAELASRFGVHPAMIHQWKHALLVGGSGVFERCDRKTPEIDEDQVNELHIKE